jgi:hypothetical protein
MANPEPCRLLDLFDLAGVAVAAAVPSPRDGGGWISSAWQWWPP